MTLQEFIDFDEYVRCICIGKEFILPIKYDPRRRCYVETRWLHAQGSEKQVLDGAWAINHALGYDMNSVEFACKDGVPYAIDFTNPAPDMDIHSILPKHFHIVVDRRWPSSRSRRPARVQEPRRIRVPPVHREPQTPPGRTVLSTSPSRRLPEEDMIDGQFTLGVEEEYQIINPETRDLRSYVSRLIEDGKSVLRERIRPEMHQSVVEVGTTVCADIGEVKCELYEMRGELDKLARKGGLRIVAASSHPFSDWKSADITDHDRYHEIVTTFRTWPAPT